MPNDRGTETKVLLSYALPAGWLVNTVATLFGRGGDREVREALRRFKQQMETNEVAIAGPGRRGGEPALHEHHREGSDPCALCAGMGPDVRVEQVPDPEILNPTAICGSDLHLWNGLNPTMQAGDGPWPGTSAL